MFLVLSLVPTLLIYVDLWKYAALQHFSKLSIWENNCPAKEVTKGFRQLLHPDFSEESTMEDRNLILLLFLSEEFESLYVNPYGMK